MLWIVFFLLATISLTFYLYSHRKSITKIDKIINDKQKIKTINKIILSTNDKKRIIKKVKVSYNLSTLEAVEVYTKIKNSSQEF